MSVKDFLKIEERKNKYEIFIGGFKKPFILRGLNAEDEEECRKMATEKGQNGQREFDSIKYQKALAIKSIIEPDLDSVELQDSYGAMDSESLLLKMLSAGEIIKLYSFINEVNGFSKSESLIKQAKK